MQQIVNLLGIRELGGSTLNYSQLGKGILVQAFGWCLGYFPNLLLPLEQGELCAKSVLEGRAPRGPGCILVPEREMPV